VELGLLVMCAGEGAPGSLRSYASVMRILTYRDLPPGRFSKALDRLRIAISQGNSAAAGLKKLSPTNYWRAKLSDEARLLPTFLPYNGEAVCLFLEVIADHAYEKSRFLRGATVGHDKIEAEPDDPGPAPETGSRSGWQLKWLPPEATQFDLVDKPPCGPYPSPARSAAQVPAGGCRTTKPAVTSLCFKSALRTSVIQPPQ
jgi:hypothetical protein